MKVMCIDDNFIGSKLNCPQVGEVVTASQCNALPNNYHIAEYPYYTDGTPQSFRKYRFIPLSDIDETELVKQRESELVNQ